VRVQRDDAAEAEVESQASALRSIDEIGTLGDAAGLACLTMTQARSALGVELADAFIGRIRCR